MRPVVTPSEMQAIDQAASAPIEVLIERAGWAVAQAARRVLGHTYGQRVLVIAGKGNNGADGRVAARFLERAGCRCRVVAPADVLEPDGVDLIIDAAYGTGFRGTYEPSLAPPKGPGPDGASTVPGSGPGDSTRPFNPPVLAVDIPSGVDGLTGQVGGSPLGATTTVTFAALKPGLLFHPGRSLAGLVEVVDIGLDCSGVHCRHLGADDVVTGWPSAEPVAHKWKRAVWIIGGSPGLEGAPGLAAAGAARGGAGYVAVSIPGAMGAHPMLPIEAVRIAVPPEFASSGATQAQVGRFGAVVMGPGLATDEATGAEVRLVAAETGDRGLVLDAGAIDAVAADPSVLARRTVPAVLTPHDGEFARLTGAGPGHDRLAGARTAAAALGAVVVLKGPTTVVAEPAGRVLLSTAGDARLGTAGTGDVLAGIIAAGLAGGLDPFVAAGLGTELHGRAARLGRRVGLVASDLPALVADRLSDRG